MRQSRRDTCFEGPGSNNLNTVGIETLRQCRQALHVTSIEAAQIAQEAAVMCGTEVARRKKRGRWRRTQHP